MGCGGATPAGWVNADKASGPGRTYADLTGSRLPFDDEAFDYAVCHHVLQMVAYEHLVPALAELRRVLRPRGVLRISTPSLVGAVRAHSRGDADWFPNIVGDETTLDGRFCSYITWYSTARSVFTPRWLCELCDRAGFEMESPTQHDLTVYGGEFDGITDLDGRAHESIYVEALR